MTDSNSADAQDSAVPDLLSGFLDRPGIAAALRCSERTISRYENIPDGLPSLSIGGRKLYPVAEARQWLARRIRRPNPRRAT